MHVSRVVFVLCKRIEHERNLNEEEEDDYEQGEKLGLNHFTGTSAQSVDPLYCVCDVCFAEIAQLGTCGGDMGRLLLVVKGAVKCGEDGKFLGFL